MSAKASSASRANTKALKALYSRIEKAKRQAMEGIRIDPKTREWMAILGRQICQSGIVTEKLNIQEKFAVVFIINHLFHAGSQRARRVKNYVQRTIVLYHRNEIKMKYIWRGEHAGTYEITYDIWGTHLPQSLVRKGKLERRGRPSVIAVFRKLFGYLFGRRR